MPKASSIAVKKLEIRAEETFVFGVGSEPPNVRFKRIFMSIAGYVPVDLRCRSCGAALPLPPSPRRWSDPEGRAPQWIVWSVTSRYFGGIQRGRKRLGDGTVISVQGEGPSDEPAPIILHFEETPQGLKWHWFCSCGASPAMYASNFEQWIGEQAQWNWPDHSRPLVARLG